MRIFKKYVYTVTALVLAAGAFIFSCGFALWVPRGVTVNGVSVGGMTYGAAYSLLRLRTEEELRGRRLEICADGRTFDFVFPEITYGEEFMSALRGARRGESIISPPTYRLADEEMAISRICARCERPPEEPKVIFNPTGAPFTVEAGREGRTVDVKKLRADIARSLGGAFERVYVAFNYIPPALSEGQIERDTALLSSFTTGFDGSAAERAHNIALAAEKLNGRVIAAGEVLSFNGAVGARTAANGFKIAKIISGGRFVDGYGGGVCQVSTTLYNAALLAGLEIVEYHPHSLLVSYVPPSRDAMVSGDYFDLRIKNPSPVPVYIRAFASSDSVTFRLYGRSDGFSYAFSSEVSAVIPSPEPVTVEGDEDRVISYAKEGAESACYLIKSKDGKEEKILLRKDKYLSVAEIRQVRRGNGGEKQGKTAEGRGGAGADVRGGAQNAA